MYMKQNTGFYPQVLVMHFALSTLTLRLGFNGGYDFCLQLQLFALSLSVDMQILNEKGNCT